MSANTIRVGMGSSKFCDLVVKTASVKAKYSAVLTRVTTRYLRYGPRRVIMFKMSASVSPCSYNSCTSDAACMAKRTIIGAYRSLHGGVYRHKTRCLKYGPRSMSFSKRCMARLTAKGRVSEDRVKGGMVYFDGTPLSTDRTFSSPLSPPPFVINVTRIRVSGRANMLRLVSCMTIMSYKAIVGPDLTHMRMRKKVTRKVNVTLCRSVMCGRGKGGFDGSLVRCGVPAHLSIKAVHIRFRDDCRPAKPFKTGSVKRVMVGAPSPTVDGTVRGTAKIVVERLPVATRGVCEKVSEH